MAQGIDGHRTIDERQDVTSTQTLNDKWEAQQALFHVRGESFSGGIAQVLGEAGLQQEVLDLLVDASLPFSRDALDLAVTEFFTTLGLPRLYFDSTPAEVIASHVHSLMSARELARSAGRPTDVSLSMEAGRTAFFAARSLIITDRASGQHEHRDPSVPAWLSPANVLERYIESKYLQQGEDKRNTADADIRAFAAHGQTTAQKGKPAREHAVVAQVLESAPSGATVSQLPLHSPNVPRCWRLQCYRSRGVLEDGSHLRLYFLQAPQFKALAFPLQTDETDLDRLGDVNFLSRVSPELRTAYAAVVSEASSVMHPVIRLHPYTDVSQGEDSDVLAVSRGVPRGAEHPQVAVDGLLLMVGHRLGSTHSFFSGLPDIYRWHGMYAVAKFVEVFRNGIVVFTFRLRSLHTGALKAAAPSMPLRGGIPDFAAELLRSSRTPRLGKLRAGTNGSCVSESGQSEPSQGGRTPSSNDPEREKAISEADIASPPDLDVASSPEAMWTPIPALPSALTDSSANFNIDSSELGPDGGPPGHHPQISTLMGPGIVGMGLTHEAGRSSARLTPAASQPEYVTILRERRLAKLTGPSGGILNADRQKELARDVGLHFVLPRTSLSPLLTQGLLSAQEVAYAYSAWKFAYHFLGRSATEFSELVGLVKGSTGASALTGAERTAALSLISRLRKVLQSAAFTEAAILDCIYRQVHVVAWLFDDFCAFAKPRAYVTTGGQRVFTPNPVSAALLRAASKSSLDPDSTAAGQSGKTPNRLPRNPASFTFEDDPAGALRAKLSSDHGKGPSEMHIQPAMQHSTPSETKVSGQQARVPLDQAMATLRKMCGTGGQQTRADDVTILTAFLLFNRAVIQNNLFRSSGRTALAFKLDPSKGFLLPADFPDMPYAIFLVVGAEFRGFHVRFDDVARGGIRLIKSASAQAYGTAVAGLFEEVYTLAHTQSRKNKDLPEGGSKGIILLNLAHQDKAEVAVKKYVDALMDLLKPDMIDGDEPLAIRRQGPELLFLGPDENTGDMMDWASQHARKRGYGYWKSFTTGKVPQAGGMPHDVFGMTSRGVRAYELGVQRSLHLGPWAMPGTPSSRVTKVQTGGPDGDLGSNEILLTGASESYIAVIDGSGVAVDLDGLDIGELQRLAHARSAIDGFDRALLGPRAFLVTVKDADVRLPDAFAEMLRAASVTVPFGVAFRNSAHLLPFLRADAFVPCGGRPASVDMTNVEAFLYGPRSGQMPEDAMQITHGGATPTAASGQPPSLTPRWHYIVEGANSFFTNDARAFLDARGVTVIKDASANKGGVTSSSLEVLAALALTDEEHTHHMCTQPGADVRAAVAAHREWQESGCFGPQPITPGVPAFYAAYVIDTQDTIAANAAAEFDALWREKESTGTPLPALSDALSLKITDLSRVVRDSEGLWNHPGLRREILRKALPKSLVALLGSPDSVLARLPATYTRALFASSLSSRFVYDCGLGQAKTPPEFAFWSWTQQIAAAHGIESTLRPQLHPPLRQAVGLASIEGQGQPYSGHHHMVVNVD